MAIASTDEKTYNAKPHPPLEQPVMRTTVLLVDMMTDPQLEGQTERLMRAGGFLKQGAGPEQMVLRERMDAIWHGS